MIKSKHVIMYMDLAERIAQESYSDELKVGCVVVKDDNIISMGWNGTPPGFDNKIVDKKGEDSHFFFHAEENALYKLARSNGSADNSSMFLTHAPCMKCARGIFKSGIKEVHFANYIRKHSSAIDFLNVVGVKLFKVENDLLF